jgi:TonB-linked SusC/RagA family outer membrane protein
MKKNQSIFLIRELKKVGLLKKLCCLCVISLCFTTHAFAQGQIVSGTVLDVLGDPVIGANVTEKGTANGNITDIDGKFSINVKSDAILVFSFIGYKTQELKATPGKTMNVIMEENLELLDEVVVVGYGSMRKKDLTGSVIQIRPDKLINENPMTVQDVLRGTPGLNVGMDASAKGGGSLQIRGQRSVYTDGNHNDPLIILDGMMFYGELSEINPDDIGQIDVLKDAAAASVYGAKSANGVIIITTKKGASSKPNIKFTSNVGFATMGAERKVYDGEGYINYRRDWYVATTYGTNAETGAYEEYQTNKTQYPKGYFDSPTQANFNKYDITLDQWRSYSAEGSGITDREVWGGRVQLYGNNMSNFILDKEFDWYDHSFRAGLNQDYNISVSGGSDRVNYYLSLGYLDNEGVVVGNDYSTVRSNMKVNGKVTKWLEIGANVNFQERTDGDNAVDWGTQITQNSPFATYKNDEGELELFPMGTEAGNKGWNYDFDQQYFERESGVTVLNSILNAKMTLPFGITYSFNASPRYQWFYYRDFSSSEHPNRAAGSAKRNSSKRFDWSLNNTITWDKTFSDKHHFVVTLVQEAEERRRWSDNLTANNLQPTDALGFHYVKAADKESSEFSSDDSRETADGMLGRLFYSYDDRYMITGAIRRDGYCAFGTSNPRATFLSTAVAWTFSNESFFKWNNILSTGKLRFSWGENGNRSLGDVYVALANLGAGVGAMQGYVNSSGTTVDYRYFTMSRLANTHLQWEKTTAWNVGLDFGFLNDRLNGSVEYYVMPTTQMIMNQSLPGFSGFGSITCNLGEVQNRGMEILVNSVNIKNSKLEWNTTLGFSFNRNEIKHLYYQYEDILDADGNVIGSKEQDDIANNWFIGKPISSIWTYKTIGIWQKDEAEEAALYKQRPGDPKVWNNPENDVYNEDGTVKTIVYDNDDKVFQGQTAPKVNWSLRNELTFNKNLSLSFNIYSKMGHKSTGTSYLNKDNAGSKVTYGWNTYRKEYWTVDNPTNDYGRLDAQGPAGVADPAKLYDRTFIRLENITLAYSLPKNIISRWNIEKATVSGSVKNVAVWAKDNCWDFWDPETGGVAPRTYNIGLTLTF